MAEGLPGQQLRWHPQVDSATLQQTALLEILGAATAAIRERGQFLLVLAGGETPRAIYRQLRGAEADWAAWHIYFGDERCLPPDDLGRNSRMVGEAWLDHVPIPAQQVHTIPAELGPHLAAMAYALTLRDIGDFDLVLLGLGEDGHTASIFPDQKGRIKAEEGDTLAVFDAPKPPAQRVSLSAKRLGHSRKILFLIDGSGKETAVAAWRDGKGIAAHCIAAEAGIDILLVAALLPAGGC